MRKLLSCFVFLAALGSTCVHAILPENGWYWNPNQSGRGFNIEIQNNLMFVSAFGYKNSGENVWYVSGGPMSSDRFYSGQLSVTSNGQCFACPYRPATVGTAGTISVSFSDESNAVISILGETISVTRQDFANLTVSPDALYGEWSTTQGDPAFPVYFAERISFLDPFINNGVIYASGNMTGDSLRVALGRYDPSVASWIVVLDSPPSYYTAYNFRFSGLNRIEGVSWTYLKTSSISGSGTYFVAHRTKSRARVKGSSAPGITRSKPEKSLATAMPDIDTLLENLAAMRSRAINPGPHGVDLSVIRELETQLATRTAPMEK